MTGQPTLLAALLEEKGLQRYGAFRAAYENSARALDGGPGDSAPSRAQFHRWRTGHLRTLPYTHHCRVLEHMLAGYSARELFQPGPNGYPPAPLGPSAPGLADVTAVFSSRSEFAASRMEPQVLFAGASQIRARLRVLNIICQQMPDQELRRLLAGEPGSSCLFLDPEGEAMRCREREEAYPPGHLAGLTSLNIQIVARLRDQLPARDRGGCASPCTTRRSASTSSWSTTTPAWPSPTCRTPGASTRRPCLSAGETPRAASIPSSSRSTTAWRNGAASYDSPAEMTAEPGGVPGSPGAAPGRLRGRRRGQRDDADPAAGDAHREVRP